MSFGNVVKKSSDGVVMDLAAGLAPIKVFGQIGADPKGAPKQDRGQARVLDLAPPSKAPFFSNWTRTSS